MPANRNMATVFMTRTLKRLQRAPSCSSSRRRRVAPHSALETQVSILQVHDVYFLYLSSLFVMFSDFPSIAGDRANSDATFSLEALSSYGGSVANFGSSLNLASSSNQSNGYLSPPSLGLSSRRARKPSSRNKPAPLTDAATMIADDPFARLDINHLDMEGIVDTSRVNINDSLSPVDASLSREPWEVHVPPALSSTSGTINGNYTFGAGPSHRTSPIPENEASSSSTTVSSPSPFSNPDPFRNAQRAALQSRNGKGRANPLPSFSISPKDIFPPSASGSSIELESQGPRDVTGFMIGSTIPASPPPPPPLHIPQNPLNGSSPRSPHWIAPESWATVPRPREPSSRPGGGSTVFGNGIRGSADPGSIAAGSSAYLGLPYLQGDPYDDESSDENGSAAMGRTSSSGNGSLAIPFSFDSNNFRRPSFSGEVSERRGSNSTSAPVNGKGPKRSPSNHLFPGTRGREKSLPQTPMSASSEMTLRKPAQVCPLRRIERPSF